MNQVIYLKFEKPLKNSATFLRFIPSILIANMPKDIRVTPSCWAICYETGGDVAEYLKELGEYAEKPFVLEDLDTLEMVDPVLFEKIKELL